jgi:hypothetical protein
MHLRSLFLVTQDDGVQPERWIMLGIRPDGFNYDVCFLPFLLSLRVDQIIIARIMHFVTAITTLLPSVPGRMALSLSTPATEPDAKRGGE